MYLIKRNRFVYIKENFFESTKLSSIQRKFFFDRISKKCFFDSEKLFVEAICFFSKCNELLPMSIKFATRAEVECCNHTN